MADVIDPQYRDFCYAHIEQKNAREEKEILRACGAQDDMPPLVF